MARARSPNRDKAYKMWKDSSGEMKLKDIADKLGVSASQIRKWKNEDEWERGLNPNSNVTNAKGNVTKQKQPKEPTPKKDVIEADESEELTEKQRLFCLYYIKTFNATQSAIKAGYAADSAHVEGSRLLRNAKVSAHIRNLKATLTGEIFLEALDVLKKYVAIAFADITDFVTFGQKEREVMGMFGPIVDKEGNPVTEIVNYVDFKDSSMVDGTIITEVKQGKDGISVKLADKMKALDKLSLYFDLFPDQFKRQIEQEKLQIEKEKLELMNKPDKEDTPTELVVRRWSRDKSSH